MSWNVTMFFTCWNIFDDTWWPQNDDFWWHLACTFSCLLVIFDDIHWQGKLTTFKSNLSMFKRPNLDKTLIFLLLRLLLVGSSRLNHLNPSKIGRDRAYPSFIWWWKKLMVLFFFFLLIVAGPLTDIGQTKCRFLPFPVFPPSEFMNLLVKFEVFAT